MADNKPEPGDRKPSYVSPVIIGLLVIALGAVVFFREPAPQPPPATQAAKPVAPQHFRDLVARLQNHSAGAAGAVPLPLPHARPALTLANTTPVSSAA